MASHHPHALLQPFRSRLLSLSCYSHRPLSLRFGTVSAMTEIALLTLARYAHADTWDLQKRTRCRACNVPPRARSLMNSLVRVVLVF